MKEQLDLISKYFPNLTEEKLRQLGMLYDLYHDWNAKINVISRKDIDNLYLHHVLHSLSIAAFLGETSPGTRFVDVGTGGGFPAVPLAIFYPDCSFHLVDRIAKKLRVAESIAGAIGLTNITIQHGDMGECKGRFDYALSRAAMPLDVLVRITRPNIDMNNKNPHPNGIICLKGGDIMPESVNIPYPIIEYPVNEFFNEPFFDEKKIVYVPVAPKS